MAKFIPVEPEKWAEMVKAAALVAEMDKTINASQAECRRLKAENERLREVGDWMAHAIDDVIDGKMKSQAAGDAYLLLAIRKWVKAKEGEQS